tara:strand:+ start:6439 stop:7065 length:627 start_codon:yes stop_codon:yes gene_type:complete
MKKRIQYTMLLLCVLIVGYGNAQEREESKFNLLAYGGIGYGIVEHENQPNYNLNSNSADVHLNYDISKHIGMASGIGLNELSGNGFNAAGSFYHERTLLKVPVVATMEYPISGFFSFVANLGIYTQHILRDEYRFLATTEEDVYDGWNFGAQMGFGFMFKAFENMRVGIHYNGQSDFTAFKTTTNQPFEDEQKMKNLNTFGIVVSFGL